MLTAFKVVYGSRKTEHLVDTTSKPHRHFDLLGLSQSDVLNQEPHHALALAMRSTWITPESRKIARQGKNLLALVRIQDLAILLYLALVVLLGFGQRTQLLIPV